MQQEEKTAAETETPDTATSEPADLGESLNSEFRSLKAELAEWQRRDAELERCLRATFSHADKLAADAHRFPGAVAILQRMLVNRRRWLAEVVPQIQARMRAEREATPHPKLAFEAARDELRTELREFLLARGWTEGDLVYGSRWLNPRFEGDRGREIPTAMSEIEQENKRLNTLEQAAINWDRGGEANAIYVEERERTGVEQEIEKLSELLVEAKATALGIPRPPTPVAPQPADELPEYADRIPPGGTPQRRPGLRL